MAQNDLKDQFIETLLKGRITCPAEENYLREILKQRYPDSAGKWSDQEKYSEIANAINTRMEGKGEISKSFLRTLIYERQRETNLSVTTAWNIYNTGCIDSIYMLEGFTGRKDFFHKNAEKLEAFYPPLLRQAIENNESKSGEISIPPNAYAQAPQHQKKWLLLLFILCVSGALFYFIREKNPSPVQYDAGYAYEVYFRGVHDSIGADNKAVPVVWQKSKMYFYPIDGAPGSYEVRADSMFKSSDLIGEKLMGTAKLVGNQYIDIALNQKTISGDFTHHILGVLHPMLGDNKSFGIFQGHYLACSAKDLAITSRSVIFVPAYKADATMRQCFEAFILSMKSDPQSPILKLNSNWADSCRCGMQ